MNGRWANCYRTIKALSGVAAIDAARAVPLVIAEFMLIGGCKILDRVTGGPGAGLLFGLAFEPFGLLGALFLPSWAWAAAKNRWRFDSAAGAKRKPYRVIDPRSHSAMTSR